MDFWERGSHALGVYPTQYASRMRTARGNRHKNNSKRVAKNLVETNMVTKRNSPKQGLTSAEDLDIELPLPYIGLTN